MENFPIQGYDLLMLVILAMTTLFGLWKGMAWQIASLASLVVSCIVAMRFSGLVAPYISRHEPWNRFLAMLILFLVTSLAIWIVFRLVAKFIDRVKLKEFDRQMGALLGLAKGILFCLVITFFAVTLSEGSRQAVLHSHSGKFAARLVQQATPAMPREVREILGKYIDEFERRLDPNTPPEEPQATLPGPGHNVPTMSNDREAVGQRGGEMPEITNPVFPGLFGPFDRT